MRIQGPIEVGLPPDFGGVIGARVSACRESSTGGPESSVQCPRQDDSETCHQGPGTRDQTPRSQTPDTSTKTEGWSGQGRTSTRLARMRRPRARPTRSWSRCGAVFEDAVTAGLAVQRAREAGVGLDFNFDAR